MYDSDERDEPSYYSYGSRYSSHTGRSFYSASPPAAIPEPVRPEPIMEYQLKYVDGGAPNTGRKTMYVPFLPVYERE